jgi:hypothetical protein
MPGPLVLGGGVPPPTYYFLWEASDRCSSPCLLCDVCETEATPQSPPRSFESQAHLSYTREQVEVVMGAGPQMPYPKWVWTPAGGW